MRRSSKTAKNDITGERISTAVKETSDEYRENFDKAIKTTNKTWLRLYGVDNESKSSE